MDNVIFTLGKIEERLKTIFTFDNVRDLLNVNDDQLMISKIEMDPNDLNKSKIVGLTGMSIVFKNINTIYVINIEAILDDLQPVYIVTFTIGNFYKYKPNQYYWAFKNNWLIDHYRQWNCTAIHIHKTDNEEIISQVQKFNDNVYPIFKFEPLVEDIIKEYI